MSFFDEFNIRQMLSRLWESHSVESRLGRDRLTAIEFHLKQMKELLMALTPEVQALVDQDAALKASVHALHGKLDDVSAKVADLEAKLAAAPAAGISAEDLEAIKAVTADIAATVAEAQDAVAPATTAAPAAEAPAAEAAPVAEAPAAEAQVAEGPVDPVAAEAAPAASFDPPLG